MLNLENLQNPVVKLVYTFKPKDKSKFTSCVIEVSPDTRKEINKRSHVYVAFSACRYADYVRTLQCFKCLGFGDLAANCKSEAVCGYCAGKHEIKNCPNKNSSPCCANCKKWSSKDDLRHSATDRKNCPTLYRRLIEKIKNINYGT